MHVILFFLESGVLQGIKIPVRQETDRYVSSVTKIRTKGKPVVKRRDEKPSIFLFQKKNVGLRYYLLSKF